MCIFLLAICERGFFFHFDEVQFVRFLLFLLCCFLFVCVCVRLGNVQPILVGGANNRRLYRVGCRVYISTSQFCHEPTMTVKIESLKIAKVNHHLIK